MIMYLRGPEGSGKTLWMTRFLWKYHQMGGTVLTFPGYQVTDGKGTQISQTLEPQDWAAMPDDLNNVAIGIDEMDSYFDAYRYNSVASMLFHGMEKQRRKRSLIIIGTVQNEHWIPPRMREAAHVVADCWDLYWSYRYGKKPVPRGQLVQATFWDQKGFYTGHPGQFLGQHLLVGKIYWPHYDTKQVVDNFNKFMKLQVHKNKIDIYPDGLPEPKPGARDFTLTPDQIDTFDAEALQRQGMSPMDIMRMARLKGLMK